MAAPRRDSPVILSQPAVITAMAVAFVLTIGASLLAALSTRRIAEADTRAQSAQQTLADASRLQGSVREAGSAARRVLLGKAAEAELQEALSRIPGDFRRFNRDSSAAGAEGDRLPRLERQLAEFAQQVRTKVSRADGPAGLAHLEAAEHRRLVEDIEQAIAALQRIELNRLVQSTAVAAERTELMQALVASVLMLAITLAGTASWLLARRMRELEGFITVCAWTRQVRWQGQWMSFEDYLATRFHQQCTHGICEEAAEKLMIEVRNSESASPFPLPPDQVRS